MIIRSAKELALYQAAADKAVQVLATLRTAVAEGVTPLELDRLAARTTAELGARPNFLGVGPADNRYQHSTCISVNDTILHGIPNDQPLRRGDIVKLDFGLTYQGLNTDHCCTVVVGAFANDQDRRLVETTKAAVLQAAQLAVAGNKVGDLGFAMASTAWEAGFDVIKEFVGHGIGRTLHEAPQIPAYGKKGKGEVLQEGMVLCVEAQVVVGSDVIVWGSDGWTITTKDGGNAAMFEYMVVVGKKAPTFLTKTQDWAVVV